MDTLFSKVTGEISAFCNFVETSNMCIDMFRKVAFLEIPRSRLLTAAAGLQSTVYNAIINEPLTKFVKGALELTENFQEMISNGVPF